MEKSEVNEYRGEGSRGVVPAIFGMTAGLVILMCLLLGKADEPRRNIIARRRAECESNHKGKLDTFFLKGISYTICFPTIGRRPIVRALP